MLKGVFWGSCLGLTWRVQLLLQADLGREEVELASIQARDQSLPDTRRRELGACRRIAELLNCLDKLTLKQYRLQLHREEDNLCRLLAIFLCKEHTPSLTMQSVTQKGTSITTRDHLQQVHTADPGIIPDHYRTFLEEEAAVALDDPIELEELLAMLHMLPCAKALSGNGFPIELYQDFFTVVTQGLLEVFFDVWEKVALPPAMREGEVCMVLKLGGDKADTIA
ncbi:hypothetical protein NDU88_007767 [Pleurodeles waltl]|uniref:Uncharacterized protein n=1 Tax=Pleurodeles waltl TaxID=8319 RepID=A0AAV7QLU6_PLEWA|nr:hypothetical protein NDU88_007767 [Pleurodeles waltl]